MNSSRLVILTASSSVSSKVEGSIFGGYDKFLLESSLAKAGLNPSEVKYIHLSPRSSETVEQLNQAEPYCIVALGDKPLEFLTGLKGIDKWNLSPLDTLPIFKCRKVIPSFDFPRIQKQFEMRFFLQRALIRASQSLYEGPWQRIKKDFHLIQEEQELLDFIYTHKTCDTYAVDIETSNGIINTMGLAWSATEAVAIRCDLWFYSIETQHRLWSFLHNILNDVQVKKILQNNIYEGTFFARYGIHLRGVWHDTMFAQKVLYPEFKSGLDVVGRLYTNEVYWKEDNKDWSRIDNWEQHLIYNCKDTTGTFEGCFNQRKDLEERGLLTFFDDYVMKLAEPLIEMCCTGFIVDTQLKNDLEIKITKEIESLSCELSTKINHRSWQHKKKLLEDKGYKLPRKRNSKGVLSSTVDELSLKKLRRKHPHDKDIQILLNLAKLEKFKSSYVNFDYHDDGIVRYSLRGTGTETLRLAGGNDAWSMGFNPQTIPKKGKKMFIPPPGHYFLQVDLSKAESWYVAHRAQEWTLLEMLNNGDDVHSFVAANIFGVSVDQVLREVKEGNNEKRQLGKKSGHGGNYAMEAPTFMDNCFKEDLVLTLAEAQNALEGYHRAFPKIRQWHNEVRQTVRSKGYLENALGWRRYFYGRLNDDTFREAYAWEPQSTIPMITNHLMFYFMKMRELGEIDFNIHLQVHDSLVLSCTEQYLKPLVNICKNTELWHPKCNFPVTGEMIIPTDCEYSDTSLGDLKPYS